jgi:hypothetical protein
VYKKFVIGVTVLLALLTSGVIGNSIAAKPHTQGCNIEVESCGDSDLSDTTGSGEMDSADDVWTDEQRQWDDRYGDTQQYCADWAASNVTLGPIKSANEERVKTMYEACMQANNVPARPGSSYDYQGPTYDNPTGGE